MDLRKALLAEHSKAQSSKIVRYIGSNPARFKELVSIFLAGPYRVTQRASWPLSYCVQLHPKLIKPHFTALIKFLYKPDIHDAAKRNILRFLAEVEIPTRLEGKVTDLSFRFLQNHQEPIAVKVFAMSALATVAQKNPELKNEIRMMIEDQLPMASPAFLSRARKILKLLQ